MEWKCEQTAAVYVEDPLIDPKRRAGSVTSKGVNERTKEEQKVVCKKESRIGDVEFERGV